MAASSESSDDFVYLKIPSSAWDLLLETLQLDSESSAFDLALRKDLSKALDEIEHLTPGESVPT